MLLTEREWRWWFGVGAGEARRLAVVQRALLEAGLDPSPDTAIGMGRTVLAAAAAGERLRALADLWERAAPPVAGPAEQGWPSCGGSSATCTRRATRPSRGRRHGWHGRP